MRAGRPPSFSLAELALLKTREGRERTGLFIAEGIRFALRAEQAAVDIRRILYCPELLSNPTGLELVRRLGKRVAVQRLSPADFHEVSILGQPQGVALVVAQTWKRLPQPRQATDDLWLGIDHLRLPGNLGTIIRSASASGARGIVFMGDGADPFDPAAVRATMGSIFAVDLVRARPREVRDFAARTGARIVGADGASERDYRAVNYKGLSIVMLGNERRGLSVAQRALCDWTVRIPMVSEVDSLNVSAAAAVLLYAAHAQRHPLPSKGQRGRKKRRR